MPVSASNGGAVRAAILYHKRRYPGSDLALVLDRLASPENRRAVRLAATTIRRFEGDHAKYS